MQQTAAIVGAGPAGLMAAEVLAGRGFSVAVYDQMPSAGRKLLMAGRGGLNLTHSEPFERFMTRYVAGEPHLRAALESFPPQALRDWAEKLGEGTFVGSSGRVFPKSFKASPLLRAWLRRLGAQGVKFRFRHRWLGWTDGALAFATPEGDVAVSADATVLACGGASWPRLGSDGAWRKPLVEAGVVITPLAPANAGVTIAWSDRMRSFAGTPLKRIALACGDAAVRGEAVVTQTGLEGGAVYALSAAVRAALTRRTCSLRLSLRPDLDVGALATRLSRPRGKQSLSTYLRKSVGLPPAAVALMHEAMIGQGGDLKALSAEGLAMLINALPLRMTGLAAIERAISTAGGVAFAALDGNFMLRARPGVFAAGEMLDWEAPTGGYLLQASFATGRAAGDGAAHWLANGARC